MAEISRRRFLGLAATSVGVGVGAGLVGSCSSPAQPGPATGEMGPFADPPPVGPYARARTLDIGPIRATYHSSRALLILRGPARKRVLDAMLARHGLVLDDAYASGYRINASPIHHWVRTADGTNLETERIRRIHEDKLLDAVVPVYQRDDVAGPRGVVAPLPHGLTVRLPPLDHVGVERVRAGLARLGIRRSLRHGGRIYLPMPDHHEGAAYVLAPHVAALLGGIKPGFDWAPMLSPQCMATATHPADSRYDDAIGDEETSGTQWNMRRIGAPYAWDPVAGAGTGSGDVALYLFDKGVQLDHPDLPPYSAAIGAGKMTQFGFQSLSNYPDLTGVDLSTENQDVVGQAPADAHGTRMAGILAAPQGGGPGSMAGLAPGCEFISLWSGDLNELWSSNHMARAIWIASVDAASRGKRGVLCLAADTSLLTLDPVPDALDPATNPAVVNLVVVAPSGRDGTAEYVSPPGNVVICGATNKTNLGDEASTPWEKRRFDEWKVDGAGNDEGSRPGADISVVAPGVGVITTSTGSSYVTDAQGTSLA